MYELRIVTLIQEFLNLKLYFLKYHANYSLVISKCHHYDLKKTI